MALGQLITNNVLDPKLLDALTHIPREMFVPPQFEASAYVDGDLPLGGGRYLLAPLTLARMLTIANIKPGDHVLDIGAGYGYTAALLNRMGASVTLCENVPEFAAHAERNLRTLGLEAARIVPVSSLAEGASAHAPYDIILIEGAVQTVPDSLAAQLEGGGSLIAVASLGQKGLEGGRGWITEYRKTGTGISAQPHQEAAARLLRDFAQPPAFHL